MEMAPGELLWDAKSALLLRFPAAGHFMQRGNFGEGPHVEVCRRDKMEI